MGELAFDFGVYERVAEKHPELVAELKGRERRIRRLPDASWDEEIISHYDWGE